MSHEITKRANGKAEMAYAGKTPWHGLGQQLEAGASMAVWQSAAGMDWTIETAPAQFQAAGATFTVPDRVVLFRSDTHDALSVVSRWYQPVHPGDVLGFFRDLTEAAGFTLETAGTLFGGKRFWALAKTGDEAAVSDPADKMKGYLLLSTSCDGSLATEARYTTVRVVCNNTLRLSLRGKAGVKVSHNARFNETKVKSDLGIDLAHESFSEAMVGFRRMAEAPVTLEQVIAATGSIMVPNFDAMDNEAKAKALARKGNPVARVLELTHGAAAGSSMAGTSGTAWGWLNAVTEFVDHEGSSRSDSNRLNSAWFGKGDAIKTAALETAHQWVSGIERTRAKDIASGLRREAGAEALDRILAAAAA